MFILESIIVTQSQTVIYGDWVEGRSTWYSEIDAGTCNYETIATSTFPYGYIAAPNEAFFDDSRACGECYQVQCLDDWDGGTDGCCNVDSNSGNNSIVTIEITDKCPASGNSEWCSGDIDHFDLSTSAFNVIGDTSCGVISMRYRRVSCDFNENIIIRNKDSIGDGNYWYALFVLNVAGYGRISKVEIQDSSDDSTWIQGETTSYNGYVFQTDGAGWIVPFSVRITDSSGRSINSSNLITDSSEDLEYDFGSNFEISDDFNGATTGETSDSDGSSDGAYTIVIDWVLYLVVAFGGIHFA